ncbi:hypothetical protein ACIBF7_01510 [Nonomuraea sp. NPDC050478]|jgi:hypothetical protein|uniref:hypothetical protein n=1 Tax=Nonomuraea sp. NPDC050478 TaxID=3364365 RepID=UPI00379FB066
MRREQGAAATVEPVRALTALLAKEFHFTQADLEENQLGRLSRRQRRRLVRRIVYHALVWTAGGLIALTVFALPTVLFFVRLVRGELETSTMETEGGLFPGVVFAVIVLFILAVGPFDSRMAEFVHVLRDPAPVKHAIGEMAREGENTHVLKMSGLAFALKKVPPLLPAGDCLLYYVSVSAHRPMVVSAEFRLWDAEPEMS